MMTPLELAAWIKEFSNLLGGHTNSGSTGAQGPQGSTGTPGSTGAQGPQGSTGTPGSTGAQGARGATGAIGLRGVAGVQGPAGAPGSTGAQGAAGSTGAPGSTGAQGPAGPQGPQGPQAILNKSICSVKNETEFFQALQDNKECILIEEDFNISKNVSILNPLYLFSFTNRTITFNLEYLFDIRASLKVENITFKSITKDFGRCFNIGGPRYTGFFQLENCRFYNMGNVVCLSGGPTSPLAPKIRISHCSIKDCGSPNYNFIGKAGAIELGWNIDEIDISYNEIENVWGNGIWVGQSPQSKGNISHNIIKNCARNAIETFSADNLSINHNEIYNVTGLAGGAGMGISAAANNTKVFQNTIKIIFAYGIELIGDNILASENSIDGIMINVDGQVGLGISVDRCTNSKIEGNTLSNIKFGSKSIRAAIQINEFCKNISVINNKFIDITEGIRGLSCEDCKIINNDFTMTWDDSTLAASCQPAVIMYGGQRNTVVNNLAFMKKGGNIAGMFYVTAGGKVFTDFSGKQILGGTVGAGFTNTINTQIPNNTNLALQ